MISASIKKLDKKIKNYKEKHLIINNKIKANLLMLSIKS